ncbi:P-loop containing nucleoside triphosphate hydrolase protein [Neofusicoccum parvum]|uniref:P-loop containing nucleoside triphosphate hydrolase protein n=1 Tax=Neofusicoccum parvum TaxID=310453 RepID=A0ACB5SP35_9PEZI|nr:P-loop containing nucleoside triphosphate hydrolase protein [Neofusicoccum parvum]
MDLGAADAIGYALQPGTDPQGDLYGGPGHEAEPAPVHDDGDEVTDISSEGGSSAASEDDSSTHSESEDGAASEIKRLYEGARTCECCINWVDEFPAAMQPSAEEAAASRKCALLVRHRRNHSGGGDGRSVVVDSIVVQSPFVKPVLARVFDGLGGITVGLRNLTFRAPFRQFFHRWDRLEQALREPLDAVTARHLRLLHGVLREELRPTLDAHADLLAHGVVTWDYLWTIFRPGDLVYSPGRADPFDRLYKCAYADYSRGFQLTCEAVDTDGRAFGWTPETCCIHAYEGTRPIDSLDFYPFRFAAHRSDIERRLLARGRRFEVLRGMHYKAYLGPSPPSNRRSQLNDPHVARKAESKGTIESRIVIDADAFARHGIGCQTVHPFDDIAFTLALDVQPDRPHIDRTPHAGGEKWTMVHAPPPPPPMSPPVMGLPPQSKGRRCGGMGAGPPPPPPPLKARRMAPRPRAWGSDDELVSDGSEETGPDVEEVRLTDEQLMLCTPELKAFSLKTKEWVKVYVDFVQDIEWNEKTFDNLVLPGGYKDLILSFVESQVMHKEEFDDIVEGKGQGIVLLLHGDPGVGKTLTAEAIAERMRTPLYVLSAAELGEDAETVEQRLDSVLSMATAWDAVVLLDESDVFLERRGVNDLERNKIVAVLLRILEYYRGILFMTTNRVEAFDKAFQSRIHLRVNYPPLDAAARRSVWRNFLRLARRETRVGEKELDELAAVELNGREIKNVVKTAQLLAARQRGPLAVEHIRTVLRATQDGKGEA